MNEIVRAHQKRLWEQWLNDENTRKFFRGLELKRVKTLTVAAANSIRTGIENAREHNLLVEANAYQKVIDTYADRSTYPYDDLDASLPAPL